MFSPIEKGQSGLGLLEIAHASGRVFCVLDNCLHYLLHIDDCSIADHYIGYTSNLPKRMYDIFINKGPHVTRFKPFKLVGLTEDSVLSQKWKCNPYGYCKLCN